jgi:hypothetical protein
MHTKPYKTSLSSHSEVGTYLGYAQAALRKAIGISLQVLHRLGATDLLTRVSASSL